MTDEWYCYEQCSFVRDLKQKIILATDYYSQNPNYIPVTKAPTSDKIDTINKSFMFYVMCVGRTYYC